MNGLLSVVIASLLGSLHCAGMCGGLVSFYAAGSSDHPGGRWAAHGAYHGTRLVAYSALGASAGAFGAVLDGLGRQLGLAALGASCAAAVILLFGVPALLGQSRGPALTRLGRGPRARPRARLEAYFAALATRARARPPLWRASVLGLSSALLPCGWLYAFVVLAAGAGSAVHGAALLAAFWSGTVPALLGLGLGVERLSRPLRAHLPRLSAVLLIGVGLLNVTRRWPTILAADGSHASSAVPSCHHEH